MIVSQWSDILELTEGNIENSVPNGRGVYELGWFDESTQKFKPVLIERATGDSSSARTLRQKLVDEYRNHKDKYPNLCFRYCQVEAPAKTMAKLLDFWGGTTYEWNCTPVQNDLQLIEDEKKEPGDASILFDPYQ